MRIFNRYTFIVGHLDFGELFVIVDQFLQEQKLGYEKLCYDIRDIEDDKNFRIYLAQENRIIPRRKSATVSGLLEMTQDYPWLAIHSKPENRTPYLASNMDSFGQPMQTDDQEADIRRLAMVFPQPYYVDGILFSYVNIDFFGKNSNPVLEENDFDSMSRYQRLGSHITFSKDFMFTSVAARLSMVIEVTDGKDVLDATPYAQALSALLGKKYTAETVLYLTPAEKGQIEARNEEAKPLLEAAAHAFQQENHRYGEFVPYNQRYFQDSVFTVAKSLKKLGKTFGFTKYRYNNMGVHYISKRVTGGHLLTLVVDTPRYFNEMRPSISLDGFGFSHQFSLGERYVSLYAESQERADSLMRTFFEIIEDLEQDYLKPIFANYPDTPAWYEIEVK